MILFYFRNSFLHTNSLNRLISVANMNTIFTCACVWELIMMNVWMFSDVGPAVQAAFRADLHCPLADHLGLSLSCLCSALRCAPYPYSAWFCDSRNTPVPNLRLIEYKMANCSFKMWQRYFMLQDYWIVLHYCTEVIVILCCILCFDSLKCQWSYSVEIFVLLWGFWWHVLNSCYFRLCCSFCPSCLFCHLLHTSQSCPWQCCICHLIHQAR